VISGLYRSAAFDSVQARLSGTRIDREPPARADFGFSEEAHSGTGAVPQARAARLDRLSTEQHRVDR